MISPNQHSHGDLTSTTVTLMLLGPSFFSQDMECVYNPLVWVNRAPQIFKLVKDLLLVLPNVA